MRGSFVLPSLALLGFAALFAGCGSRASNDPNTFAVSGFLTDGAISNASCSAYQITASGAKGPKLAGPSLTSSVGAYSLSSTLQTSVLIECSGGSFTDWATGSTVTLTGDDKLTGVGTITGDSVRVDVTPLTTMATALALKKIEAGATVPAGIAAANASIAHFYGLENLTTSPVNPTAAGSATNATQAQIDYGMLLAGFAWLAQENSIPNPLDLARALASDASDGVFDGMLDSTPVPLGGSTLSPTASTSGLADAIGAFAASPRNASEIPAPSALMALLAGSDGTLGQ